FCRCCARSTIRRMPAPEACIPRAAGDGAAGNPRTRGGRSMGVPQKRAGDMHGEEPTGPVPWMQQLLDNPFLLLFLGVFVPMVLYTVWGVYDILTLPMAK